MHPNVLMTVPRVRERAPFSADTWNVHANWMNGHRAQQATWNDKDGDQLVHMDPDAKTVGVGGAASFGAAGSTFSQPVTANAPVTVGGTITITGAARRILADFSAASTNDRTVFQSSVANGLTSIAALPNGTSTVSAFAAWNNPSDSIAGANGFAQLVVSGTAAFVQAAGGVATVHVNVAGANRFTAGATGLSFFGGAQAAKPTVSGSRGGNAALASLLTGLAALGLVTDSSSA